MAVPAIRGSAKHKQLCRRRGFEEGQGRAGNGVAGAEPQEHRGVSEEDRTV
jgi:hypothetical protein